MLRRVRDWLVDRLGLETILEKLLHHPVPAETTRGFTGWLYVLGFVTAAALIVQLVTGIALTSRYIPATGAAFDSVRILTEEDPWGRLIRGMHFWGATAMVAFMLLHVLRVFLMGAYKFPREMSWLTGVALLVIVLIMAFTGQLLRWNQDGLWGVVVASQYAGRVPLVGEALKRFILAGDAVGGATLGRFFSLHVVLLPMLLLALVGLHMYMVVHHGISEKPKPGRPVDPKTYRREYDELMEKKGLPYWPFAAWQEAVAAAVMVGGVITLALLVGPRALGEPPDPTSVPTHPRPDWFLMWYYALLAVKPRGLEDVVMIYLPLLALAVLVLLPFVRNRGERAPSRRPLAVASAFVVSLVFVTLTVVGYRAPWVPALDTQPLSRAQLGTDVGDDVLDGARVFHAKGCQYCHVVAGAGGNWGPELTDVAARMSAPVMVDRIINGVGEMPAYRGSLDAEELAAIVTFLQGVSHLPPELER